MSPAKRTVPITNRALIQRINRALKKDDQVVKATRGDRWRAKLGDYYRLHVIRNFILETHVDLEELGRKLEALKDYEHVVTE